MRMNEITTRDLDRIKESIQNIDDVSSDWIHNYYYDKIKKYEDCDDWSCEYNHYRKNINMEIHVDSVEKAILWRFEIRGQISDGAYENHRNLRNGKWETFCYANVVVDKNLEEPKILVNEEDELKSVNKSMYGPDRIQTLMFSRDLTECEGHIGRMLFYVRSLENKNYSVDDLKTDLTELEEATRNA